MAGSESDYFTYSYQITQIKTIHTLPLPKKQITLSR